MSKDTLLQEIYTYQDVLSTSLEYFNNDELAATTWINKYCLKDKNGNYLERSPDDMHHRMADQFGRIESKYLIGEGPTDNLSVYGKKRKPLTTEKIYKLFKDFKYVIPQGSVMYGLGNNEVIASLIKLYCCAIRFRFLWRCMLYRSAISSII